MKGQHMKRFASFVIVALAVLTIAGCSTASTDRFVERLGNFNRGVAAVDDAIAKVSATLYRNCKSIQAIAQAADDITGQCAKASPVVTAANAIVTSYCQREQVTDIASAVQATAATVQSTKSQLSAAKAACAKGG